MSNLLFIALVAVLTGLSFVFAPYGTVRFLLFGVTCFLSGLKVGLGLSHKPTQKGVPHA